MDAIPSRRVLFIGSGPAWRGGAGHLVRQRMFLEAWGAVADGGVTAALFHMESEDASDPPPGVQVFRLTTPGLRRESWPRRLMRDLVSPLPRSIRVWDASQARRELASLRPHAFDAVFAFRIDFAHWAGVLHQPGLLLDVDDPEHVRAARRVAMEKAAGGVDFRTRRDLLKLRRFERAAVRKAAEGGGGAFVCQEGDRSAFPGFEPMVVPNSVIVPPRPEVGGEVEPVLMMMGNFAGGASTANADALRWFLREVWPLVRRDRPGARFRVVGRMTPDLEHDAGGGEGVELAGFAEDLGAAFEGVAGSVVPIRFGTGTRIKILDAFARGCPVVSTTMGADGLMVEPERDLLIGDDPPTLAAQCVRVLDDPELRQSLSLNGYRVVERRYNQARTVNLLSRLLPRLAWGKGAGRTTQDE